MADEPPELAWRMHHAKTVSDDRWLTVSLLDVQQPDGHRFDHHAVRLHPVAIALLVNDDNEILTLWRHRFVVDEWGYEIIGGLVEAGEDPAAVAAREAVEETGWKPLGEPEHLLTFQPLPGMIDAPMHIYRWRRYELVGEPTDAEEVARIEWIPVSRLLGYLRAGQLLGSGTIVAILCHLLG